MQEKDTFSHGDRILVPGSAPLEPKQSFEELPHLLLRTGHWVDARLDAALEARGLSLAKMGVLRQLVEAGAPLSLGQLAERLNCVRSNVTQLIDRLEADGLVKREQDPADRRSVQAVITEEGKSRYFSALVSERRAKQEILEPLSEAERLQLTLLLARLANGAAAQS